MQRKRRSNVGEQLSLHPVIEQHEQRAWLLSAMGAPAVVVMFGFPLGGSRIVDPSCTVYANRLQAHGGRSREHSSWPWPRRVAGPAAMMPFLR